MTTLTTPQLRWYQEEAVDAVFDFVCTQPGHPLIVLPTGAGKSLTMASVIQRARSNDPSARTIILATQAELVQQNVKAAALLTDRRDIGIYSAGLNQKDATRPITVANIQSIAKQAYSFEPFDLILIDEAHQIPDHDNGLYRRFLDAQKKQNPDGVLIGFTATPYKLSSGLLYGQASSLFTAIAYEAPILRLIEEGYLCRPTTPKTHYQIQTDGVGLRGGEFIPSELSKAVDLDAVTEAALDEVCRLAQDRQHWLIFAVSVEHATHIGEALQRRNISAVVVHGELSRDERAYRLDLYKTGQVRAAINVNVLTTGFDHPATDCVVLMRPTNSPGLYSQMVGRGMRVHPSKTDCLIVDVAGLIEKHGPVDAIRVREKKKGAAKDSAPPAKLCPVCETFQATSVRACINCGHEFPPPAVELSSSPSTAPILSSESQAEWIEVTSVQYLKHEPKPPKTIPTLRTDYYRGYRRVASEWVCLEHDGFARGQAERWWKERSPERAPMTIDAALPLTDDLRQPLAIQLAPDPKNPNYQRIVGYRFPQESASGLPRACWTCCHWLDRCQLWAAVPPADVQSTGCDDWSDLEPLPF